MKASRSRLLGLLMLVIWSLAIVACGGSGDDLRTDSVTGLAPSDGLSFVIPVGAGEALDAGTPLEILPGRLEVSVGDVIEIRNEDDRGHLVGPFFVGASETLVQQFSSTGEFIGACTVHPSGEIVVAVTS